MLLQRHEFELLEMIALHQSFFTGGLAAASGFASANAPQWLRVAAWLRQNGRDHNEMETAQLMKHNPEKMLSWLEKHLDDAMPSKPEMGDRYTINRKRDLFRPI